MITKHLTRRSTTEAKQSQTKSNEAKAKEAKQTTNTKLRCGNDYINAQEKTNTTNTHEANTTGKNKIARRINA